MLKNGNKNVIKVILPVNINNQRRRPPRWWLRQRPAPTVSPACHPCTSHRLLNKLRPNTMQQDRQLTAPHHLHRHLSRTIQTLWPQQHTPRAPPLHLHNMRLQPLRQEEAVLHSMTTLLDHHRSGPPIISRTTDRTWPTGHYT